MKFDLDEIKNSLSIEQVEEIVAELGGEPQLQGDHLICATICHNHPGEGSHKLYYYSNTKLFRCYTECDDTFDIVDLIIKVMKLRDEEWTVKDALLYIANFFAFNFENDFQTSTRKIPDWEYFKQNNQINEADERQNRKVEFKFYDNKILKNLPQPRLLNWERDGITKATCDYFNIHYDPSSQSIIIPHYDRDYNLVGIRQRTLIKEDEIYGKYRPAYLNGHLYNHALGFNLYGLERAKNSINSLGTAIVAEGEKSCLQHVSYFGMAADIVVAACGSNLTNYQIDLLIAAGAKEIIIAFDRQYKEIGDKEYQGWTKKLISIGKKIRNKAKLSYIFDTDHILKYKQSPWDAGADTFLYLYKHRLDSNGR